MVTGVKTGGALNVAAAFIVIVALLISGPLFVSVPATVKFPGRVTTEEVTVIPADPPKVATKAVEAVLLDQHEAMPVPQQSG